MIVLEVLASFRRAALFSLEMLEEDNDTQSSGESSGQNYHSPGMENTILSPYNYSFI